MDANSRMVQIGFFFKQKSSGTWNYTATPPVGIQGRPDYDVRNAYLELPQKNIAAAVGIAHYEAVAQMGEETPAGA